MQEVSATSSFLASLRAAGIDVVIGDRLDRVVSPATVHGAPAVAAQHEQPQEPLRDCCCASCPCTSGAGCAAAVYSAHE